MENEQDLSLLEELKQTNAEAKDDDSLWKETAESFSTDGLDFVQISAMILDETEDLFAVTRTCDRFAPIYLQLCDKLLKAINHLGSVYLTKTAFIQRNYSVAGLETLTAERLNQMISFNIRKCKAALETIKKGHDYDQNYFAMMLRLASASERLRVTQHRAYDMNLWLIRPHKTAEQALSFGDKDGNRKYDRQYSGDPAPFRNAGSYALRYDALEEAEAQNIPSDTQPEGAEPEIIQTASDQDALEEALGHGPRIPSIRESGPSSAEYEIEAADRELMEEFLKNPPEYMKILYEVQKRSAGSADGSVTFTCDEIDRLLEDPQFCYYESDLAGELRKVRQQIHSE